MAFIDSLAIKLNSDGVRAAVKRLRSLGKSAKRAGSSINRASKAFRGFAKGIGRSVFRLRNLVAVIGTLLLIRKATNEFADFELQMAKVKAVTNASAQEFVILNKLTRTLGATTVFTAKQAGQALLFLSQAGLTAQESVVALPQTLKLAQAGFLGLPQAADIAVSSLKGFGLSVNELGRVGDVLANTASSSKVTIETLGRAFSFAAPLSRALGVSIEQTAAIIGVLGNRGLNAGRAGRGLNQFFAQLSKATPDTVAALKRYGLTIEDVNIQNKGAIKVIETLDKANLSVADTYKIFGKIGGLVALSLRGATKETGLLTVANTKAAGSMNRMAREVNDTTDGLKKGFTSAVSEAWIQLGKNLNPAFINLTKILTGALSVMNGMGQQFFKLNNVTKLQAKRIKDLGIVFINLKRFITGVFTAVLELGPQIIKFVTTTLKNAAISFNKFINEVTGTDKLAKKFLFDADKTVSGSFARFFATTIVSTKRFFLNLQDWWTVGTGKISIILGNVVEGWAKIFSFLPDALGGAKFQLAADALSDTVFDLTEKFNAAVARTNGKLNIYSKISANEDKALLINTYKFFKKGFTGLDKISGLGNSKDKKKDNQKTLKNLKESLDKEALAYKQSQERAKKYAKEVSSILAQPAESLKDSLADALLSTGNVFDNILDAASAFINDLNRVLTKKFITGPLVDFITGAIAGGAKSYFTPSAARAGSAITAGGTGGGLSKSTALGSGSLNLSKLDTSGGGRVASVQSKVTIIDQRTNAPAVQQKQNGSGDIEVIISDSIKKNMNNGGFDGVLGSNYNLNRNGEF